MIISFTSSKGGVGKSTACAAIAYELARQGGNVLIFDLDQNRTLESWANRAKPHGITARSINPKDFKAQFDALDRATYDHILIDVAGMLDKGILRAFSVADLVVIPTGTSQPDIVQAFDMAEMAAELRAPFKLLLTRVQPLGSLVTRWSFDQITSKKLPMFDHVMIERTAYKEMFVEGRAPYENIKAGAEVHAIVHEIKQAIKAAARRAAA